MAVLRRSIQLVQDVAEQLASGAETVKLYSEDVDRLHYLGALYGVRPTRQARGRVRLLEMVQRSSVPRTRTPRYWARRTPSAIERHWLHEKQAMGDIHFRENFIVVYAVGFVINLGLGLLTGQVRRCPMPHGEMAHLDYLLGRRPEPAPVCGTYYVTKHDGGHCGRETCRKVHMLLTNEYLLDEAKRNRKAELDARA